MPMDRFWADGAGVKRRKALAGWVLAFCVAAAFAPGRALALGPAPVWPPDHFVFQRADDGFGRLQWLVRSQPGAAVHARLLTDAGGFLESARVAAGPDGLASVRFSRQAPGFYRVSLADASGKTVLRAAVGECFLVAGQSNAVSTNYGHDAPVSSTGMVVVNDYYDDLGPGAGKAIRSLDRLLVPSADQPIRSNVCWTACGDILAGRFGVPVGFLNVAVSNTDTGRWNPQTGDLPAMLLDLQRMGVYRAVLWQQGESDVLNGLTEDQSQANLAALLKASRDVTPGIPWFIARNSLKSETPYAQQPVRRAQEGVIARGLALAGPDTDQVRETPRWVGVADFCFEGLDRNGELWAEVLAPWLASRPGR